MGHGALVQYGAITGFCVGGRDIAKWHAEQRLESAALGDGVIHQSGDITFGVPAICREFAKAALALIEKGVG